MNLILLSTGDFVGPDRVILSGRRLQHVREVHRAAAGEELVVGVENGKLGKGQVLRLDDAELEMTVTLGDDPPPPLPLVLLLAMPRPKALNRILIGAASMGVKRIVLFNCWRVEKSYWSSPRLSEENITLQLRLGLEQARDTIIPSLDIRRRFTPFVEDELSGIVEGTRAFVAHPLANEEVPRAVEGPVTLAIGPEGGFIENEIAMLAARGFTAVHLGKRPLRVEHAIPAILGRMF